MPAYAGTAVADETPGTISKAMPAFTQACASSGPEAKRNGSPAISRTTRRPDLACRTTTLARAAWVSGWPSVPKPPSTSSGARGRHGVGDQLGSVARRTSVIDAPRSRPPRTAARRRARSAGRGRPGRCRRTRPVRPVGPCRRSVSRVGAALHGVAHVCLLPFCLLSVVSRSAGLGREAGPVRSRDSCPRGAIRRRPPSISAASRRADVRRRRPGGPLADRRTERAPSGDSATARIHSSSPSSPSTTSASAPTGALQPASRSASSRRSAVTAAAGGPVVEHRAEQLDQLGVVGAALDRERALARGRAASAAGRGPR